MEETNDQDQIVNFVQEKDILGLPKNKTEHQEHIQSNPVQNKYERFQYADLSDRLIAGGIDIVVLVIISYLITDVWLFPETTIANEKISRFLNLLIDTLYFAGFESSSWQATLGKKIIKIKVINKEGKRISFLNGVGRYFAKGIAMLPLFWGVIRLYRDKQKQGWHDMMANTLVIKDASENFEKILDHKI